MKTLLSIFVFVILCFGFQNSFAQSTIEIRGIVDIVGQGKDEILYLNYTNVNDSNFDALRARLFVEGGTERTHIFLQTLFSQGSFVPFRLYGAYLMHRVLEEKEIYLEAGLIPVHDGIWAPNTYSNKNPLAGIPLAYYWKSNLHSYQMPVDIDQLVSQKGQGQTGVTYADSNGVRGTQYHAAPILYDNCWNYGVYSLGVVKRLEYAAGITLGAPTDPVQSRDTNEDITLHAKVGYAITPGLRMHLSAATGAYLADAVSPYLPGTTINDYRQNVFIVSAEWQWRYLAMMGEFFWNEFETPIYSETLRNTSAYLQAVYTFHPGWYVAARYDELRFAEVQTSTGVETWDQNLHRWEAGLGYHVSRELLTKLILQQTDEGEGWTSEYFVTAVQVSFAF